MTRSILAKSGCCVLFALLSTSLAGCGSNSAGPAPDAAANDVYSPPDTKVTTDTAPSTVDVADTAHAAVDVADTAHAAVDVADAAPSTVDVADAAPTVPDFGFAASSVQRIADPQVPAADSTTLASDNADFAFAAYKQLIATNTNLVFSPASISIALAMTYAGAAGTTASEMARHFISRCHPRDYTRRSTPWTRRSPRAVRASWAPMAARCAFASSTPLWAEQTYTFKTDFLATLAANYGADVNLLDFAGAPEASRLTINDWVA